MKNGFLALAVGLACVACSSESPSQGLSIPSAITEGEAVARIAPAFCQRVSQCNAELLAKLGGSVSACIDTLKAAEKTPNENSECTVPEVDACRSDIEKSSCEAVAAFEKGLPSSCAKC